MDKPPPPQLPEEIQRLCPGKEMTTFTYISPFLGRFNNEPHQQGLLPGGSQDTFTWQGPTFKKEKSP